MKKLLTFAVILIVLYAFKQEKQLQVKGTVEQWDAVMQVLEQSNAPHQQVKFAQQFLLSQLQEQLADTTQNK